MILYLSGGSAIPEHTLASPAIMLSFWVNTSNKKKKPVRIPDARLMAILKMRRKERRKNGKSES